jgi:hypothetical protein
MEEKTMSDDYGVVRDKEWWENYPLHKIWCNDYCPLVPRYKFRPGDELNSNAYSFHWLIFYFWTMDHVSFGLDCGIDLSEIYVAASLPYLRITIGVRHIFTHFTYNLSRKFRRKPAKKNT